MSIVKILTEYNKKTITLEELGPLLKLGRSDTMELYETVTELVGSGSLKPVYSHGQNGNRKYPLYKKYRIIADNSISPETSAQINRLHPALLKSGYLSSHPKEYTDNKDILEKLSRYLFHGRPEIPVSRKERSFEIFGREKILDDSGVKTLLHNLEMSEEDLGFYNTPEYCFHDYIPERKNSMVLLICENKDIWFNIRRCMFEDNYKSLFGVPIDGVVFGNGNEVTKKQGALTEYIRFMGDPIIKFLYWGDIDREGFDIFRRTREVNSSLDIRLFIPGYRKMIERARHIEIEDSPSLKKEGMSFEDLIGDFPPDEKEFLNTIFAENKLVPQEIIPYTLLSER